MSYIKRLIRAFDKLPEVIVLLLDKATEDLARYPESRYWQGYFKAHDELKNRMEKKK